MAATAAIMVIIVGAIFTFVLSTGPAGDIDLRVIGIILMLGGTGGLLTLVLRSRSRWSQSTVRSRQDVIDDGPPPPLLEPPGYTTR
jgi:hypothetical protein